MASSGKRTCTPQQMEDVQGDNRWMDMVRSLSGIDTVVFVICLMSTCIYVLAKNLIVLDKFIEIKNSYIDLLIL